VSVAHGRRAVAILETTPERWWLGLAHWGVAFGLGFLGDFAAAREAVDHTDAIGHAIGDPRLQAYAAWTAGWLHAGLGDHEAAVQACRRSLEHSPDPVNTADAMSFLGYALLERGEVAEAIRLLEHSVGQWAAFQHAPMLAWFTAVLAEAYLAAGDRDRAGTTALRALTVARDAGFPYGAGLAARALARIARAEGRMAEAARLAREALDTFRAIQAGYEEARTSIELAAGAAARGEGNAARQALHDAQRRLEALGVSGAGARVREAAARLGLTAPESRTA
jgi:tetratricopeptide (TPR) repeat protein